MNLVNVHVPEIKNYMELWELLSEMCTMKPFIETDVCSQHSFVQLALKFVRIQQLELMDNHYMMIVIDSH